MNPSFMSLINNYSFFYSCIITQITMYASMIINDLFDINIDRINNPSRPLLKQIISIYEAVGSTILLYITAFTLNNYKINGLSRILGNISIILSILYIPVFKKVLAMKNVICSMIVCNSILYSGLLFYNNKNTNILILTKIAKIIFVSSLYIEILQDIKDYQGDKLNNIYTIPVVFNKNISINIILSIIITLIINLIISNFAGYESAKNLLLIIPFYPMIKNLLIIKKKKYSDKSIDYALKNTSNCLAILFLIVLYIIKVKT